MIEVYTEDCISACINRIPDNSVDLIICDPPYGINGDKLNNHYNRNDSNVISGYCEVSKDNYYEFSIKWIKQAERILKVGGSMYVFSGYTNLYHILNALHQTKLTEINHLIWKYNFGVYTSKKYVSSHYHLLYWIKGNKANTFNTFCRYGDSEKNDDKSLNYLDREDVFIINRENKPNKVKNINELPTELLIKLLQYSSNEGDLVCDMFLGGGNTGFVAKGLNRNFIGFDINPKSVELSKERINSISNGCMLSKLRIPESNKIIKHGKWNDYEVDLLKSLLKQNNKSKKEIIQIICEKTGRGYFSVLNKYNKLIESNIVSDD